LAIRCLPNSPSEHLHEALVELDEALAIAATGFVPWLQPGG